MRIKCIEDYKGLYGAVMKGKIYEVIVANDYSYAVKDDMSEEGCMFEKHLFIELVN